MTKVSQVLEQQAMDLIEQGHGRVTLERELGLSNYLASQLVVKYKVLKWVKDDPGVLDRVREHLAAGLNRYAIRRILGCTEREVACLVDLVDGVPRERAGKVVTIDNTQQAQEVVADMLAKGMGVEAIHERTGIRRSVILRMMADIRQEDSASKSRATAAKFERLDELTSEGLSPFKISRVLNCKPSAALTSLKRRRGVSVPDQVISQALAKGARLSDLRCRFGVASRAEVLEIIADNFPGCLVYESEDADGDVSFGIVSPSGSEIPQIDESRRDFKYSVSPERNYMYVQFDDDRTPDEIKIYNFTDVHIGSKACRLELLKDCIKNVENDPGAYLVFGGDMFEFNHRDSAGDPMEQELTPNEQVFEALQLFSPVAHKILAYRGGNHDAGRGKRLSVDLAEVLAGFLRVPYFKVEATIQFKYRGHVRTLLLDHGRSRSSTPAAILADVNKFRSYTFYPVHWHMSGHVHRSLIDEDNLTILDPPHGFRVMRYFAIVGGSFTRRTGTYAEEAKYPPSTQDLTYLTMTASGEYGAGRVRIDCE